MIDQDLRKNDIYIFGLWVKSIKHDLAWRTLGHDAPRGRPRECPSWSWAAATDVSIYFETLNGTHNYSVEHILGPIEEISASDVLQNPVLLVKGFLLPVSMMMVGPLNPQKPMALTRGARFVRFQPSSSWEVSNKGDSENPPIGPENITGAFFADYKFWSTDAELQSTLSQVTFFEIGTSANIPSSESNVLVSCMLLRCVGKGQNSSIQYDRYERIGWFRYEKVSVDGGWQPEGTETTFALV